MTKRRHNWPMPALIGIGSMAAGVITLKFCSHEADDHTHTPKTGDYSNEPRDIRSTPHSHRPETPAPPEKK